MKALEMRTRVKHVTDFILLVGFLLSAALAAFSQNNGLASASPTNGEEIIPFLNQTIVWYRQITLQQQLATEPSDVLFLNDNRQIADQVVRQAFDFARARAQALAQNGGATPGQLTGQASQYQRLADSANKADQQVKQEQQSIDDLRRQLATATGKKRSTIEAQIGETQSELELYETRRDVLRTMLQFATGASG